MVRLVATLLGFLFGAVSGRAENVSGLDLSEDQCVRLEGEDNPVDWHVLPEGLLYRSYVAGEKEPRMAFAALYDLEQRRLLWECVLGGRIGLLRQGTHGAVDPRGFQLDFEGAVMARLLPDEPSTQLEAADFRFGLLGTWRDEGIAFKAGYYHISSHLGDEFLIANPGFPRVNYVRDAAIVGTICDVVCDVQAYGEVAHAVGHEAGAKPWEFQLGTQFLPEPRSPSQGAPYGGINTHVREDFGYRGSVNVVAGWNWIGEETRRRLRLGVQYYRGPSLQYSFLNRRERLLGGGLWLDY